MEICAECHVALLEPHPELVWWKKCPVCGYCCISMQSIDDRLKEHALKNPLMKRYSSKN
jgi:hypothetical protein